MALLVLFVFDTDDISSSACRTFRPPTVGCDI